jgi:CRISPR-associated protein Cas1
MKHLLNTLYVTTHGAYLARDGESIVVRVEQETKLHVPVRTLGSVVCLGSVMVSPPLMALCAENGVAMSFLSEQGRFLARVEGPISGNVALRREQYHASDSSERSAEIARSVVIGKIANCRTVLLRAAREREEQDDAARRLGGAAERLAWILDKLKEQRPLDTVRGYEGEAAAAYFGAFDDLIAAQKDDFRFTVRSRRPPLDSANALLSFLYTLLGHDIQAALESVGLDPQVGYLHRDRPGRPGLALDLLEELRPYLCDRLALTLINRQQVKGTGFTASDGGAVLMDAATRKEVLVAYQKRKQEEITHPFIDEKIAIGLLPFVQAQLMARHIRGDVQGYAPFVWR